MKVFNRRDMKARRRQLRRKPTLQEQRIYEALRGRKLGGVKFRFNSSIGHYVVDFYCPSHRLAIEIDGHQHHTVIGRGNDALRTEFLSSMGIQVIRFTNREVDEDIEGVLVRIADELARRPNR